MKRLAWSALSLSVLSLGASAFLVVSAFTNKGSEPSVTGPGVSSMKTTTEEVAMVSPALDRYTNDTVRGELWKRPGLSARDRSIATLAALVARNHTTDLPY